MASNSQAIRDSKDEHDVFDFNKVITQWAYDMFSLTATRKQRKLKLVNLNVKIIWDDIVFTSEAPQFFEDHITRIPKSHALFSTTFKNNTDAEQEYSFRTERSTRSVAEIEISKGFSVSTEFNLKLGLPTQLLEANAGFKTELSLSNVKRQTKEEALSWGVDTRIIVPPHRLASAQVTVMEKQLTCRFSMVTTMQKQLRVVVTDVTRNNEFVKYLQADISTIVNYALDKKQKAPGKKEEHSNVWVKQLDNGEKVVYAETSGKCIFRFGVLQEVEVDQKTV